MSFGFDCCCSGECCKCGEYAIYLQSKVSNSFSSIPAGKYVTESGPKLLNINNSLVCHWVAEAFSGQSLPSIELWHDINKQKWTLKFNFQFGDPLTYTVSFTDCLGPFNIGPAKVYCGNITCQCAKCWPKGIPQNITVKVSGMPDGYAPYGCMPGGPIPLNEFWYTGCSSFNGTYVCNFLNLPQQCSWSSGPISKILQYCVIPTSSGLPPQCSSFSVALIASATVTCFIQDDGSTKYACSFGFNTGLIHCLPLIGPGLINFISCPPTSLSGTCSTGCKVTFDNNGIPDAFEPFTLDVSVTF